MFYGEDTFVGYFVNTVDRTNDFVEMQYQNGQWNVTYVKSFSEFDFKNVSSVTSTSVPAHPQYVYRNTEARPTIFSKQQDGEWTPSAYLGKKYFESYETFYSEYFTYFNGNDTIIYLGSTQYEWSSGTVYIAEYQKNTSTWKTVKKFNSEDAGLELDIMNQYFTWATSVTWINQDMAFLMAPNFPTNFNETDFPYGGSVVMVYRDSTGEWQMGGRISIDDDDTGEAVRLTYLTRTASDIMILGSVGVDGPYPLKYFLYRYPLCFPQPLNVTCLQDVEVASCNEADPNLLTGAYEYVVDNCGKPMVTIANFTVSNYKATVDLQFERMGFEVGQCTATLLCPIPPVAPPTEAVSAADRVIFNVISLVTFLLVLV